MLNRVSRHDRHLKGTCRWRKVENGEGKFADKPGSVERADPKICPPGNHSSGRRVATSL